MGDIDDCVILGDASALSLDDSGEHEIAHFIVYEYLALMCELMAYTDVGGVDIAFLVARVISDDVVLVELTDGHHGLIALLEFLDRVD